MIYDSIFKRQISFLTYAAQQYFQYVSAIDNIY